MASDSGGPRKFAAWRVVLVALPVVHGLAALLCIYTGELNTDEGFYAVAARAVMAGELPYRDFGYTQMPLLPYINGAVMTLTGFGLFAQRAVNGFWGALALIFTAVWLWRRTSPLVALGVVATFTTLPAWMYFVHMGKTYAFTALVAAVATCVFAQQRGGWKKQVWLALLGVIGTGCRLPAGPFFAVLWVAAFWHAAPPRRQTVAAGVGAVLLWTALLLLPWYLAAPENARFWMFDFHAKSVALRTWRPDPLDVLGLAPAWGPALLACIGLAAFQRRFELTRERAIALAALAALAGNLVPRGAYAEYATPFLLPLAGALACELFDAARARGRWLAAALGVVHLGIVPVMGHATGRVAHLGIPHGWLAPSVLPPNYELRATLLQARAIVEEVLPPDTPLIGPNIILAAETGRPVPKNARMASFSITDEMPADRAQRLNLMTYAEFYGYLADERLPLLAFHSRARANYVWSVPSFRLQPQAETREWLALLRRDFVVAQQDYDFYILVRRSALERPNPR